ncbi:MAG: IS1-like element transposase [Yersinia sp. (in: enterobacteria)]
MVDMAMNSLGYRDTVQVMGISLNTALQHLKNVAKTGGREYQPRSESRYLL